MGFLRLATAAARELLLDPFSLLIAVYHLISASGGHAPRSPDYIWR